MRLTAGHGGEQTVTCSPTTNKSVSSRIGRSQSRTSSIPDGGGRLAATFQPATATLSGFISVYSATRSAMCRRTQRSRTPEKRAGSYCRLEASKVVSSAASPGSGASPAAARAAASSLISCRCFATAAASLRCLRPKTAAASLPVALETFEVNAVDCSSSCFSDFVLREAGAIAALRRKAQPPLLRAAGAESTP